MADREMTNEEAIEILGGIRACYNIFDGYDEPKYAALSKAILALKAEPTKHEHWIEHHEPFTWMGYTTWTCSKCDYECGYGKEIRWRTSYCPNCGVRMEDNE